MEVYLIRHGESERNAKISFESDAKLTELGKEQAQRAAEALIDKGIKKIFCSAQHRGLHTAYYIQQKLNVPLEVITDLAERGLCGNTTGLTRSAILTMFPGYLLPEHVDEEGWARHWQGESYEVMVQRMKTTASWITRLFEEGEHSSVALVIHNASGSMFLRHVFGVAEDAITQFRHSNCGISRVLFTEEKRVLLSFNDVHHLNGLPEFTVLPDVVTNSKSNA